MQEASSGCSWTFGGFILVGVGESLNTAMGHRPVGMAYIASQEYEINISMLTQVLFFLVSFFIEIIIRLSS